MKFLHTAREGGDLEGRIGSLIIGDGVALCETAIAGLIIKDLEAKKTFHPLTTSGVRTNSRASAVFEIPAYVLGREEIQRGGLVRLEHHSLRCCL